MNSSARFIQTHFPHRWTVRNPHYAGFDRLALTAKGRVQLKQVLIKFADGSQQLAKLDMMLTERSRAPMIDLAGSHRRITGIIVYTADDARGELTLYAL